MVAGRTECAFNPAQDNFSAGVRLLTVITVNTKVLGIIESPFMIPILETVSPDFFRDCSRILTQEPGDILKGSALIKFIFDIDTVFKGKVLVTRNIFAHHVPPSTAVRRRNNHTMDI